MTGMMPSYLTVGGGQFDPWSLGVFEWNDIRGLPPISNVVAAPARLASVLYSGTDAMVPQDAFFKVYEKASPDPLVDGPDICLPFIAGEAFAFDGRPPGFSMREGDVNGISDGAYFDWISIFTSLNPGTDETVNPITSGQIPAGMTVIPVDLTSVPL